MLELARQNHSHENAPSRVATRALGRALEDPDPSVRAAAREALVDRQHAGEACPALDQRLRALQKEIEKTGEPLLKAKIEGSGRKTETAEATAEEASELNRVFDERTSLVMALARLDTPEARACVLRAADSWTLDLEVYFVPISTAGVMSADPLRAREMIAAVGSTLTRRHVEALVELEERLAKLEVADLPAMPAPEKRPSPEDVRRTIGAMKEMQVALNGRLAAMGLRTLVHEELASFGERAGFSPPPENWSLWRDWIRENAAKLEPAAGR